MSNLSSFLFIYGSCIYEIIKTNLWDISIIIIKKFQYNNKLYKVLL